jgi:o-succinylbenzoate synthase
MNELIYAYIKRDLAFSFEAKTSRGPIKTHQSYLIYVRNKKGETGWGEAAPLKGLSIDALPNFEEHLAAILQNLNEGFSLDELQLNLFPSIQFAIETAQLDIENGGKQILFPSAFLKGEAISINGLVWMADLEKMYEEAIQKAQQGFDCIKFKIGAHDHDAECRLLEKFRKSFPANKVEIRLDANGAFHVNEALQQIQDFSKFTIHSIEQPIAPNQAEIMQEICAKSRIPIALDEELIGIDVFQNAFKLLKLVQPKFLILKPTLLGGLKNCNQWIQLAQNLNISWWATSALESNVGLNSIAQWCATKNNAMPQGLGTGALYTNNIPSPLVAEKGKLQYALEKKWNFPIIES